MSYIKDIVRTAARDNGWQLVIDNGPHSYDTYLLSDKRIGLYWAASGHVLMATYWDDGAEVGPIDFVLRGSSAQNPTAVTERVLSALAGRTPTFPQHRSNDPAFGRPCELRPHEGSFLPEVCTVIFTDGTERYFNPDDQVEIKSS